jgi:phosphohistidine phosphatase SixA/ADP-ribose pyrophosphatase YjhB (NUDIX family)
MPNDRLIRAAGAVAWQPGPDGSGPEVLLVHRMKYDDWSLPKGKAEPGEPLPVTAVREILEEGGARLALGRRLISVRYQAGGRPKRVHYWAARVTGTDDAAVPNAEVDKVVWLPGAPARDRLSYARDSDVLDDFARLPADTVPLILLRHARAVSKSDWHRDDAARPLDEAGRADAQALAALLACFAPAARVVSSPALRCLESVRPYADLCGGMVQAAPGLHVRSFRTDGGASATALISEAVAAGKPAVFCAHRENLPVLHAAAAAALGAGPPGGPALPADWDQPLPTGGFRVLHISGGALVAADCYDLSDT